MSLTQSRNGPNIILPSTFNQEVSGEDFLLSFSESAADGDDNGSACNGLSEPNQKSKEPYGLKKNKSSGPTMKRSPWPPSSLLSSPSSPSPFAPSSSQVTKLRPRFDEIDSSDISSDDAGVARLIGGDSSSGGDEYGSGSIGRRAAISPRRRRLKKRPAVNTTAAATTRSDGCISGRGTTGPRAAAGTANCKIEAKRVVGGGMKKQEEQKKVRYLSTAHPRVSVGRHKAVLARVRLGWCGYLSSLFFLLDLTLLSLFLMAQLGIDEVFCAL